MSILWHSHNNTIIPTTQHPDIPGPQHTLGIAFAVMSHDQ
jgi:hypothetical protein